MAAEGGEAQMAVRCSGCDRLSRNEETCEWCKQEVPAEVRQRAARRTPQAARVAGSGQGDGDEELVVKSIGPAAGSEGDLPPLVPDEALQQQGAVAVAGVADEKGAADSAGDVEAGEEELELVEPFVDRETLVILGMIFVQLALTLYLGGLSWWSATGFLWLLVTYGVWQRETWALALPLVLFTLDIATLLFGIGPREIAGLPALGPLDFFILVFRLFIWGWIWRLREEMS